MMKVAFFVALVSVASAAHLDCTRQILTHGVSRNYNETIAHAIHSMTVEGLQAFTKAASENNFIPTVNHDIRGVKTVRSFAPRDPMGSDFRSDAMNTIDKILSNLGKPTDGLGENWSPLERVVHNFHMLDLWTKIHDVYAEMDEASLSSDFCRCLLNVEENGIYKAVQWVADNYKTGTPITLLGRPIPKLEDAESWVVWKDRLLHYYSPSALKDAAIYLRCVAMDME